LAGLGMVLAGHEGPEEATLRQQASAALRALLVLERREIVRLANQRFGVHARQRVLEGPPELLEDVLPAHLAFLDLVELAFHLRGEADIELAWELLHHHLLDALAEFGGEETPLLQLGIVPLGERRDDARVRRRAADAALFELLHERGLGV